VDLLSDVDSVGDRPDLVDRIVGIAADLELDERRVPARCVLVCVGRVERRLHVLDGVQRLDSPDDVLDHGPEGRVVRP
jgi:hypothetical protein